MDSLGSLVFLCMICHMSVEIFSHRMSERLWTMALNFWFLSGALELYLGGKIVRSKSFCICGVAPRLSPAQSHTDVFRISFFSHWMVHFPLLARCVSSRNSSRHTEYIADQRQMI